MLPILGQVAGALGTAAARGSHAPRPDAARGRDSRGGDPTRFPDRLRDRRAVLARVPGAHPRGCRRLPLARGAARQTAQAGEQRLFARVHPGAVSHRYRAVTVTIGRSSLCMPTWSNHRHAMSNRRPDLPPELDAVVARGMAKDPRERYPSAGHLILAAGHALGIDVPVLVRKPGHEERRRSRGSSSGGDRAAGSPDDGVGGPRAARERRERLRNQWTRFVRQSSTATCCRAPGTAGAARSCCVYTGSVEGGQAPAGPPGRRAKAPARGAAATWVNPQRRTPSRAPTGMPVRQCRRRRARAHPGGLRSDKELREAERAYRRLAAAARGRNRRDWRVARRQALRREAALQRELRRARVGELEVKGG